MNYQKKAEDFLASMRQIYKFAMMQDINDLSQGEMAVLGYLTYRHDGATAGELTAAFNTGTSRTAAVLNTLERKGLARRDPDIMDKRRVLVFITEQGRQKTEQKYEETISHIAEFFELIGQEDAEEYIRIIQKAVSKRNLGRPEGDGYEDISD